MKKSFVCLLSILVLAGCGPIIGSFMVAGGGVKDFQVLEGSAKSLTPGANLLVLGPLDKTERAYYICRGDEAAKFTSEINASGLFKADFHLADRYADNALFFASLKQKTPATIQQELGLSSPPDILLTGVVLHRSTVAAPTRGVLMDVGYRLEFYDLKSKQKVTFEVEVKNLFQDCITDVVSELLTQITR